MCYIDTLPVFSFKAATASFISCLIVLAISLPLINSAGILECESNRNSSFLYFFGSIERNLLTFDMFNLKCAARMDCRKLFKVFNSSFRYSQKYPCIRDLRYFSSYNAKSGSYGLFGIPNITESDDLKKLAKV